MELLQALDRGFVAGELHQIAAHQKIGQRLLLSQRQEGAGLKFDQKFLGRALRRAQREGFFEVGAQGIGNHDAEGLGFVNQFERLLQLAPRAFMRRDDDFLRLGLGVMFPPIPPAKPRHCRGGQRGGQAREPDPTARDFHRRFDVANVAGQSIRPRGIGRGRRGRNDKGGGVGFHRTAAMRGFFSWGGFCPTGHAKRNRHGRNFKL